MLCDRCGLSGDVVKRTIVHPESRRQVTFEACAKCARTVPLAEWEALMPRSPRGSTRRPVVSEAVVRQASRKAVRKARP